MSMRVPTHASLRKYHAGNSLFDRQVRLLLVGDSGTGKTDVLVHFADPSWQRPPQGLTLTIGIDYKIKFVEIEADTVRLQVWDTAGLVLFRAMTRTYLRGAQGVLLFYDPMDRSTFDNCPRWLEAIRSHGDNGDMPVPITLVSNFWMRPWLDEADQQEAAWQVSVAEGVAFAESRGLQFCSLVPGNSCVDSLFTDLAGECISRGLCTGPTVPGLWTLTHHRKVGPKCKDAIMAFLLTAERQRRLASDGEATQTGGKAVPALGRMPTICFMLVFSFLNPRDWISSTVKAKKVLTPPLPAASCCVIA